MARFTARRRSQVRNVLSPRKSFRCAASRTNTSWVMSCASPTPPFRAPRAPAGTPTSDTARPASQTPPGRRASRTRRPAPCRHPRSAPAPPPPSPAARSRRSAHRPRRRRRTRRPRTPSVHGRPGGRQPVVEEQPERSHQRDDSQRCRQLQRLGIGRRGREPPRQEKGAGAAQTASPGRGPGRPADLLPPSSSRSVHASSSQASKSLPAGTSETGRPFSMASIRSRCAISWRRSRCRLRRSRRRTPSASSPRIRQYRRKKLVHVASPRSAAFRAGSTP